MRYICYRRQDEFPVQLAYTVRYIGTVENAEDKAEYAIRAASEEEALDLATEWFSEREPDVHVEIDNDADPDIELD